MTFCKIDNIIKTSYNILLNDALNSHFVSHGCLDDLLDVSFCMTARCKKVRRYRDEHRYSKMV